MSVYLIHFSPLDYHFLLFLPSISEIELSEDGILSSDILDIETPFYLLLVLSF